MLRYRTDAAASKYWLLVGTCMYMRWRVDPQRRFSQKTVQVAVLLRLRLTQGYWDFALFSNSVFSSVFLTEDDVPPSNQLGTKQLVAPEYTSALAQPEGLRLPEVALPLSKIKMQTAHALLHTLRQFCRRTQVHGGVGPIATRRWCTVALPSFIAWVFLADSAVTVICVEFPSTVFSSAKKVSTRARDVYVYQLVNAAPSFIWRGRWLS